MSFAEGSDIHTDLLSTIDWMFYLVTPSGLEELGIEDDDEQQAVRKIVFQQIVVPSEKYIWHLGVNRFLIVDGDQSQKFMIVLAQILRTSTFYQRTMEFSPSMVATLSFSFATTLALLNQSHIAHRPRLLGNSEEPKFFFIHANPHLASFANGSSTDSIPSVRVLISSAGQIVTNTTMLSLKHVTQHCPELLPPHLTFRQLKPMDRFGFGTSNALLPPSSPLTLRILDLPRSSADPSKADSEGSKEVVAQFMAVLDSYSVATHALPPPLSLPATLGDDPSSKDDS
ncbi:hypothetical protein BLNAU_21131 [Blattamonas nauphoetae]|uniref:Uncharacterized protein n=1 Tax=Blattamonas nauphoetae TaxID=2049346 RepID=A0ABQ9WWP4_9EUKA|nr:hypothetical protein BLNAU_21131 [Blattamonas nauphoetae]